MNDKCPLRVGRFYRIKYEITEIVVKPTRIYPIKVTSNGMCYKVHIIGIRKDNQYKIIKDSLTIHQIYAGRTIEEISEDEYNSECMLELL